MATMVELDDCLTFLFKRLTVYGTGVIAGIHEVIRKAPFTYDKICARCKIIVGE